MCYLRWRGARQLNLRGFVEIKDGGGHASYAVARMLQAFDAAAVTYTGMINQESARDIGTGKEEKLGVVHEFWFENGAFKFKIEMKRQLAIRALVLVTESHDPWVVTLHRASYIIIVCF